MPKGKVIFCDTCRISLQKNSYSDHINGKNHKREEEKKSIAEEIVDKGLFITGFPKDAGATELAAKFGQFGGISKVEIYGRIAFLTYTDKCSVDEALKHQHAIGNNTLVVNRRKIAPPKPEPSRGKALKRSATTEKPGSNTAMKDKAAVDHKAVLDLLADAASLSEQFLKMKRLILADRDHCDLVKQKICNDLSFAFKSVFSCCKLYPFGSMVSGLAFIDSDLDIYAQLEINKATHLLHDKKNMTVYTKAKSCLYRQGHYFKNIIPIQNAKTPIIKFVHGQTSVSCDLSFRDPIGHCNSHLLRHYLNMNEKFFDLMLFIKYWARVHGFISTSKLSSFALCMLVLSYLISLKDAMGNSIVPPVQELMKTADPSDQFYHVNGWRCAFNSCPISITLPDTPDFEMPVLLAKFFEYIAHLPFENHVISVLTGELISREVFQQKSNDLPEAYDCYKIHISKNASDVLCAPRHYGVIHDPFKLNHNLIGRVSKEDLHDFIGACRGAASQCAKVIGNKELLPTLLPQLLTPSRTKRKDSPSFHVQAPQMAINNPFNSVTGLLHAIFTRLLLLKINQVTKEKNASGKDTASESKIAKIEGMQDVCDDQEEGLIHVFTCQGDINAFNGRAKAKSSLHLKNPLSFEDEERISAFLAKNVTANTNVNFKCRVFWIDQRLHFQFEETSKNKKNFKDCFFRLKPLLLKWLPQYSAISLPKEEAQGTSSQ